MFFGPLDKLSWVDKKASRTSCTKISCKPPDTSTWNQNSWLTWKICLLLTLSWVEPESIIIQVNRNRRQRPMNIYSDDNKMWNLPIKYRQRKQSHGEAVLWKTARGCWKPAYWSCVKTSHRESEEKYERSGLLLAKGFFTFGV